MSHKIKVRPEDRPIVDEIFRIQALHEEEAAGEPKILDRLHRYDLNRLWERLHLSACTICYVGRELPNRNKCRWWERCQSYLKMANLVETEAGQAEVEISVVFEIEEKTE